MGIRAGMSTGSKFISSATSVVDSQNKPLSPYNDSLVSSGDLTSASFWAVTRGQYVCNNGNN